MNNNLTTSHDDITHICGCDLLGAIHHIHPPGEIVNSNYDSYLDRTVFLENGSTTNISEWARRCFETRWFSENMEHVRMMCPLHHPFFKELIQERLNLRFEEYRSCIQHAWYHAQTMDLKVLWADECGTIEDNDPEFSYKRRRRRHKISFGLAKAWRMYSRVRYAIVETYTTTEEGEVDSDDDDHDYEIL